MKKVIPLKIQLEDSEILPDAKKEEIARVIQDSVFYREKKTEQPKCTS